MEYYIVRLVEAKEGELSRQYVSGNGLSGFCDLKKNAQVFDSIGEANATANALQKIQNVYDSHVQSDFTTCYKIEEKKSSENVYGKEWRKMTGGVQ